MTRKWQVGANTVLDADVIVVNRGHDVFYEIFWTLHRYQMLSHRALDLFHGICRS
jgi:hypothetical protein